MLDPYNLWVYNISNPATSELPSGASTSGYKPGPQVDAESPLKLAANSTTGSSDTYVDSYVSDGFINEKLKGVEVQLTANGNITVTSNVTIKSDGGYKFQINAGTASGYESSTGNLFINNATIDVKAGVLAMGMNKVSLNNSNFSSESSLTIGSGRSDVIINNSNLSGAMTTVSARNGDVDITGGRLNGTTTVSIAASTTNGSANFSGVSVNTKNIIVGGSNITLDNVTLNVTPASATQGIKLGTASTKNVVIKNSTLNTTGTTAGVINIQGTDSISTANAAINANGTRT